jgi:tetratricopeptide (TPR) repeat protein
MKRPNASLPISTGFWHYTQGIALTAKGDLAGAKQRRLDLAAAAAGVPEGSAYGFTPGADILGLALAALDGRIAAAEGDLKGAAAHFEKAVSAQDKLPYNEPADWYYPVRETLGAILLRDGQAAKAEEVFRADLMKHRRNPRSLFGLWQALAAQGKDVDAELVRARFETEWKHAEIGLKLESL